MARKPIQNGRNREPAEAISVEFVADAHRLPQADLKDGRQRLLTWYRRDHRDLPWRRRPDDPYAQLVAELMLQQTQVATVVAYYQRFLERFPTVQVLATAPLDDVLALWSGLGYYRRARHLQEAARAVVEKWGGRFPDAVDSLMSLPGVGRYTAGAIASIVFGCRAPVLDGNVARVLTRWRGITQNPRSPEVQSALWALATDLLPRAGKACGDLNQALMELGATVCTPRAPGCLRCPLWADCRAHAEGTTDQIPAAGRRTKVQQVQAVVVAVQADGRLLFVQRPARGLWAGLWELPWEQIKATEDYSATLRRLKSRLPLGTRVRSTPLGHVDRLLSHRAITFHVYTAQCTSPGTRPYRGTRPSAWRDPTDLADQGISQACRAILDLLD